MPHDPAKGGKVYLVGAGPGDPGLITVRGIACLRKADLILYDYLVNPAVLENVPESTERICLGRQESRGPRKTPQKEINARMLDAVRQGKTVVRLKAGDPDVFGRGAEETEALRAAGIPYESVPGVTAGLAAAGYAGIPITHGQRSSAVVLITGQERHDKEGPSIDYGALADFPGTLIFYMGVSSAGSWSGALIERGKSPETPVMIVRRCTWTDQTTIRCTLGTVAEVVRERELRPPTIIVVGEVVSLAPELSWFARRPLIGKRVMVTRPRRQTRDLAERLVELGADVVFQPAIEISDPPDWAQVDGAIERIGGYDWLVFSSANGVQYFLDRLWDKNVDLRKLGQLSLAAIGPGTADELARYRLKADLVPKTYRAEALAEELSADARGKSFLLARASRGREVLSERLAAAGAAVDQIVVYSSDDVERPQSEVAEALAEGRIDWITVTSSAIGRSLARLFGQDLRHAKLASISPITSEVLSQLGYEPRAEAEVYTMDGLLAAILAAESRSAEE
jgi:uroporphyrinogen III methyltransferase/synthase